MDTADRCIGSLAHFPAVLRALIEPAIVSDDELMRRRGPKGQWSIVEILCHLADEEIEDFRVRLELTLTDPQAAWPGIDPEGVATSRNYLAQDPREALERFVAAREVNLIWLCSLSVPVDLSIEHVHPRIGSLRAGDMLASWTAHDLLHLRQITKRLFEGIEADSRPFSTAYAGSWTT